MRPAKKRQITISLLGLVLLCMNGLNCGSKRQEPTKSAVSEVLKESPAKAARSSSSSSRDMVDQLYEEALKENDDLRKFDTAVGQLNSSANAELNKQRRYQSKNDSYYSSALNHTAQIKTQDLKQRLKAIIGASKSRYMADIRDLQELMVAVDSAAAVVEDYGHVVKVLATLPFIEGYQKSDKPGSAELKKLIKDFKGSIDEAESLIRASKKK